MAQGKYRPISSNFSALISAIGAIVKSPIVIAWVLSIGGLVALTAMSIPKLRATRIAAANVQVTFDAPPTWLDDSLLSELQDVVRIHLAKTTIGREGLMQAVDALETTGWFSSIEQIQWVSSNKAHVHATFLIPYAKVRDAEGVAFIDTQAKLLPTRLGSIVKPKYYFITLDNPNHMRPQRNGLQWEGDDVVSGINLLKHLYDKPWVAQIQSINLERWDIDGSMTLVTDTPSQLNWGSAPGEERGLEALANEKIDRLNWMYTKFGRIDQGVSRDFDLTDTDQIIMH